MPKSSSSNTPTTVKLEAEDEFVFKLKYGNFTKAKHGYSLDGSIKVEDGDSVKNARIYISRAVRDQIINEWPGREGLITADVVSDDEWNIQEVVESEYAKYDPQLRAWNNDTNSFEEIDWDEEDEEDEEDDDDEDEEEQPRKRRRSSAKSSSSSSSSKKIKKGETTFADLVVLFGASWDAAGSLPVGSGEKSLVDCGPADGLGLDVRYKAAFTLFKEARMAKVMPREEEPDQPEDPPEDEEDNDDLPF